ncbi:MAG TPA: alpha/beta fold hydrolase [Candidatus Binataceae bacterium]|nr:alpha/beta fold hydrolase [Candidatus Binataceae bacterium]
MPRLKVGDINVHYDVQGGGEPLLMIMGLGASSAAWDAELVQELAKSFRTITFDNRGTGQTDKPDQPYSVEIFADDAAGVLDGLNIPRAHIFGVSMGGMIAQEFALRHSGRTGSLTLGCTTAGGAHSVPPPPESLKVLTAPREGVPPEEVIRRGWPLAFTPEYLAANRAKLEARIPRLLEHPTPPFAFKRQMEGTYTLKTWDRLPEIKAPTLVITGAKDVLIPAANSELLAGRIPGAKLHMIPNAGHGFTTEALDEFLRVFVQFVKSNPIAA